MLRRLAEVVVTWFVLSMVMLGTSWVLGVPKMNLAGILVGTTAAAVAAATIAIFRDRRRSDPRE